MKLINDCQECTDFDALTRKMASALFHDTEKALLIFLLADRVKEKAQIINGIQDERDIQWARHKADADFAGQLLGKMLISLEEIPRQGVLREIRNGYGMKLNMQQQPCPHRKAAT